MGTVNESDFKSRFNRIDAQLQRLYSELDDANIQFSNELQDKISALEIEKEKSRGLEIKNRELNESIVDKDNKIAELEQDIEKLRKKYEELKALHDASEKDDETYKCDADCIHRIQNHNGMQRVLIEKASQPMGQVKTVDFKSARKIAAQTLYRLAEHQDESWWHTVVSVLNGFTCTRLCHLYPIFCGYASLMIAKTLAATIEGEIPDVIVLNPAFRDAASLDAAIINTSTHTIIIDGFDRVNQAILLPILRKKYEKKLIFVAENIDRIQTMPSYLLYYCALVVYDGRVLKERSISQCHLAEEHTLKVNQDGYREWYVMLQNVQVDPIYYQVRKDFFNCITPEKKNPRYMERFKTAFEMYYQLELKWVLDNQQIEGLRKYLDNID
ncbi:hypothetical protein [Megasphaera sp.]|uniref:hypothetical protein n=1 Tax=Megasphaera sp. TaxID=2023260 RepID=UPI00257D354A|nr:hypothetical protein [Megasphaera sp.]